MDIVHAAEVTVTAIVELTKTPKGEKKNDRLNPNRIDD